MGLSVAVVRSDGFDDGAWVDAFVDVEGDGWDVEGCVFCLACPLQLRVDMRVEFVAFLACVLVGFWRYQTDGGIIRSLCVGVGVRFDFAFASVGWGRHGVSPCGVGVVFLRLCALGFPRARRRGSRVRPPGFPPSRE